MKRLMFFCMMLLCTITCMFAQTVEGVQLGTETVTVMEESTDYASYFATFAALVALVPIVVEAFKRWFPKMASGWVQFISWIVGLIIVYFGWFFDLGCLEILNWWQTLLYGIGISLAANGVADTGVIEWIVNLFCSKAQVQKYNDTRSLR